MLGAFWVLLAVATAATHFGVSSDAGGRISARSVIAKFFSLLSNVFPFRAASLGLQATFGLGPKIVGVIGGWRIRHFRKRWTGHAIAPPTVLGLSMRCMVIRGNLFSQR
jgi:hypothetical protein